MHPSIYDTLVKHLYFWAVWIVEIFLNGYGAYGVIFLTAALIISVMLGHRLNKLCSPDRALLLYFPRALGWLIGNSALILMTTIWIALILVHGLLPSFVPDYDPGALQQWWAYVESYRVSVIEGCVIGAIASYIGWYAIGRWLEPWCAIKLQLATRTRDHIGLLSLRRKRC